MVHRFRIAVEYIGPDPVESVAFDWLNDRSWIRDIETCLRQAAVIGPEDRLTSTELEPIEDPVGEHIPDLTCPYCNERMVRAHWEIERDWRVVWICGCKPDPAILEAIQALRDKTGECVIAMFGT